MTSESKSASSSSSASDACELVVLVSLLLLILAACRRFVVALPAAKKNVTLETSAGKFTVELYWREAPKTCANFLTLAARGYYNNVVFHRIIRDFIIQGGDPTGTGRGGQSIYGYARSLVCAFFCSSPRH